MSGRVRFVPGACRRGAAFALLLACALHAPAGAQQFQLVPAAKLQQLQQSKAHPDSSIKLMSGASVKLVANLSQGISIRPGDFVSVPTPAKLQMVDGNPRYFLPSRAVTKSAAGESFDLQAFLQPTTRGLRLTEDGLTYAATILIGVVDQERPAEARRLPRPIQVMLIGDEAGFDPPQISLERSNDFKGVELSGRPTGSEVGVEMRVSFTQTPLTSRIPVMRPTIGLAGPPSTEGLGIGQITVHVLLSPGSGSQARPVQVWADGGVVRPDPVSASELVPASTAYRGHWLGTDTVRARAAGLSDGRHPIELTFPWRFLIAALLGGGLGAWVLRLLRPRRDAQALARYFLGGVLFGLLVASLYVLGVNVTPVALPAETVPVAIFAIAAVGAIVAIPLVSKYSEGFKHLVEGDAGPSSGPGDG